MSPKCIVGGALLLIGLVIDALSILPLSVSLVHPFGGDIHFSFAPSELSVPLPSPAIIVSNLFHSSEVCVRYLLDFSILWEQLLLGWTPLLSTIKLRNRSQNQIT